MDLASKQNNQLTNDANHGIGKDGRRRNEPTVIDLDECRAALAAKATGLSGSKGIPLIHQPI